MNFKEEFTQKVDLIEDVIKSYLPEETGYQKIVFEAMNYSVLAGGKRLRPMFILETYHMFGGEDLNTVRPFLAAIEMIHTYSLVHDDLPAMDNDDYRRGRLTTHKVYGESQGILAGDALLNYAFETVSTAFEEESLNMPRTARAFQVLARKAGVYGMIGGQVVDVQNEGNPITKEELDFINELKTGALIEASLMIGAILAGATDSEVDTMEKVAKNIGYAFQIKDDILDVTSTIEELGKPIHSDIDNNKTTYVSLFGIDGAQRQVEEFSRRAINAYDSLNYKNEFLRELILSLISRKK